MPPLLIHQMFNILNIPIYCVVRCSVIGYKSMFTLSNDREIFNRVWVIYSIKKGYTALYDQWSSCLWAFWVSLLKQHPPPPKKKNLKKNEKEQKTLSANRKIQFPQILNWLYVDCKKFMHKNNSKSKLDQNHKMDLQFDLYRVFSVWTFESYFTCEI